MPDPYIMRLHNVLSTNIEPSSSEIEEIKYGVEKSKTVLQQLGTQIAEVHAALITLFERQEAEQDLLSLYQCALSPIRRIPQDVLFKIFLFTREWGPDSEAITLRDCPVGPLPRGKPLVITHVCSEWRRIALSFPLLWNTIISRPTQFLKAAEGAPLVDPRLQSWLERTGTTVPLDITFNGPQQRSSSGDHPTASVAWMSPYKHRIRNLSLSGRFCDLPGGQWQSLETLRIDQFLLDVSWSRSREAVTFPSLRHVGFRGAFLNLESIPWQQLTELSLEFAYYRFIGRAELLNLLAQTKSLVHLTVKCTTYDDDEEYSGSGTIIVPAAYPYLLMDHIESLTIRLHSKTSWLLDSLTLPALETLHITQTKAWSQSAYKAFSLRSSFTLTSLLMQEWRMDECILIDILEITPSLEELHLIDALSITPILVAGLKPLRRLLAPNLEYLHIRDTGTFPSLRGILKVPPEAICEMISTRSGEPAAPVDRPYVLLARNFLVFEAQHPKRPRGQSQVLWEVRREEDNISEAEIVHIYF